MITSKHPTGNVADWGIIRRALSAIIQLLFFCYLKTEALCRKTVLAILLFDDYLARRICEWVEVS
jgi:hypothetical protein